MFKKSEKTPFTPFTCNKLIYRMLNKKVKGEGLKTLFIYVRVGKGKKGKIKKYPRVKNRKSPKKNII
jgi:hypothetical protein